MLALLSQPILDVIIVKSQEHSNFSILRSITIKKKVDGNKGIFISMKARWYQNRSLFKDRLSILLEIHLQITEERRKRVIDLYFNQHKSYAEIAQIEKISPRDIHAIVKEEQARRQKYKHQQQQEEISSKAYKLFSKGKKPVEVAIALNLREPEATKLCIEYWS